jgi:hypothetical protein
MEPSGISHEPSLYYQRRPSLHDSPGISDGVQGITGMLVVGFFAVALLMLLRFKIKKSIGSV